MSKNQKLINVFNQFLESKVGALAYGTEKYDFQKSYSDCALIAIRSGGSEGGDCYGGSSSSFSVGDKALGQELIGKIESVFSYYFDEENNLTLDPKKLRAKATLVAQDILYSSIGQHSDGSDWYGNHNVYKIYKFNVTHFLKGLLPADKYEVFEGCAAQYKFRENKLFQMEAIVAQEKNIIKKIENFNADKTTQRDLLENRYQSTMREMKSIEVAFTTFEADKIKEQASLNNQLQNIQKIKNTISNVDKRAKPGRIKP